MALKMLNFVLNSHHLREVLLRYFILKKTAAESDRILMKVYGEHALSDKTCRDWFRRFKSGDFDLGNKDRGKPTKKSEDAELQALLDEDSTQTLKQLTEHWKLTRELFPDAYMPLERSRKKENGCRTNQKKETLKGEKPLVKFCSIVAKESYFCFALLLAMKKGSISTIPSAKNHG